MGGGGFSMEPENPLLDRFVLSLSPSSRPRVCFLQPGESPSYFDRFYAAFGRLPCEAAHLSLFSPEVADIRSFLLGQEIVYVGGGNTKSMLALWREWGLDHILREAWLNGVILAGLSAGAICWFSQGVTDSIPGALTPLACLGLLSGSACPHYDSEAGRQPTFRRLVASGEIADGYAADDGVALHFIGEHLHRVVSSRPNARAYRVVRAGDQARETEIQPDYLAGRLGS
ncbi:MAG TPA: peptidase E [Chloroflexota bacterium]|nr:peptidase E [Chloroflexota bacterium]